MTEIKLNQPVTGPPGTNGVDSVDALLGWVRPIGFSGIANSNAALSAPRYHMMRYIIPKTGVLRDISAWVATANATGVVGVHDCGAAAAGVHTRLFGTTFSVTTGGWRVLADPGLPVTAGQHILMGMGVDVGVTSTFARALAGNAPAPTWGPFPFSFGERTTFKPYGYNSTGSVIVPATLADTAVSDPGTSVNVPWLMARIAEA